MSQEIKVTVDRNQFLSLVRILRRQRRAFDVNVVTLSLGDGQLRIEFPRGGRDNIFPDVNLSYWA